MFCRGCGAEIPEGSAFCEKCGMAVRGKLSGSPDPDRPGKTMRGGGSGFGDTGEDSSGRKGSSGRKKDFPIAALLMLAAVLLLVFAVFIFLVPRFSDGSSTKRYGGARVRKQEIWSAQGLSVTADRLDSGPGDDWGRDALWLRLTNNGEAPVKLLCESLKVNGAAVQPKLDASVNAGETVDAALVFDTYSLNNMRIRTIGSITMELALCDPGTGSVLARSGPVTAVTDKEKKADEPLWEFGSSVFYEKNGIKAGIVGLNAAHTEELGAALFYVENNSAGTIQVGLKDTVLNGSRAEIASSAVFPPGSKGTFYAEMDGAWMRDLMPSETFDGTFCIRSFPDESVMDESDFHWKAD